MQPTPSPTSSHAGMYIQLGLGLSDPEVPVWSIFSRLIEDFFQDVHPREVPYLRLAGDLLGYTAEDLKNGLALVRRAVETGTPLSGRLHWLQLNYLCHAVDWLNECDDGGICVGECAGQLGLSPRVLRRFLAGALHMDTRGEQALIVLPPSFFAAVKCMTDLPKRASKAPTYTTPSPLVADAPQHAKQPALWGAWAKVAKSGNAARRAASREAS